MSRIGKRPVAIPAGVKVAVSAAVCRVEGPKGRLEIKVPTGLKLTVADGKAVVALEGSAPASAEVYGTTRALLADMVQGVHQGFQKGLEISGVGFKAEVQGKEIVLSMGFNHPVKIPIPDGVEVKVEKSVGITISGADRARVGQLAALVRRVRPADPYKAKGIKYAGEVIRRKAGKATVAKAA
ncbi:MAG: 50S ribosomal protein L6 [Nitrospirae bacterium]|nr:50S ribosomal protein L6 [Nitrospirota bacterium]